MPPIQIITKKITRQGLKKIAAERFGDLVKAVVDVKKEIMAIAGDMHADEEQVLMEQGSEQKNLWGVNLYPTNTQADWIEFDSVINIRPSQNNRSRSIDDPKIQEKIVKIVNKLVESQK